VDLPHDWAVELEHVNVNDNNVMNHGYKPIGREFPRTSVGWYRRTFSVPVSDEGRTFALKFDGVFRDSRVWVNGHYIGSNLSGYGESVLIYRLRPLRTAECCDGACGRHRG
jgi:beta-galactosidase